MTNLLNFPDWVPPWVQLAVLILASLFALAFLAMPFSVFGVKSRLEALEERLDELQGEIRALSMRLPELHGAPAARETDPMSRPPIPPAAWDADARRPLAPRAEVDRARTEPRLGDRRR